MYLEEIIKETLLGFNIRRCLGQVLVKFKLKFKQKIKLIWNKDQFDINLYKNKGKYIDLIFNNIKLTIKHYFKSIYITEK